MSITLRKRGCRGLGYKGLVHLFAEDGTLTLEDEALALELVRAHRGVTVHERVRKRADAEKKPKAKSFSAAASADFEATEPEGIP